MKKLIKELSHYNKIIVTGPPRSGTTIAGLIISDLLGYKFIDESFYDGNDADKFIRLFTSYSKLVIHNTSFLRDFHKVGVRPIVIVKRRIKDILDSMDNTKKFGNTDNDIGGIFTSIDEKAQNLIKKHYNCKNGDSVPEVIYNWFEKHNKDYYEINYDDLKTHRFFIPKEVRRANFSHIKQTSLNKKETL